MHDQRPHAFRFASLVLLFGAVALAGRVRTAEAHVLWTEPKPRDSMDGWKPTRSFGFVLPCGVARAPEQPINKLPAGSTKTVAFTETVGHPGCFMIDFATSDQGPFGRLTVIKRTNAMNFTASIKLPSAPCTGCVLRLRQFMLASDTAACPPTPIVDMSPDLYYSCANVTLEAAGGDASAPDAGVADAAADVPRPDTGGGSGGSATGTGGSSGSGGSGTGTGGSTGSGGASAGTGGKPAGSGGTPGHVDPGASGCAIAARTTPGGTPPGLLLIGLLAFSRRRRAGLTTASTGRT